MSNAYEVNGVTITPIGGGYYDLTHASLTDPERIQGKEKAEARANEIAKAAEKPEGHMEAQGDLTTAPSTPTTDGKVDGDPRSPAEKAQERDATDKGLMDQTAEQQTRDAGPTQAERDQELADLKAQLAASQARTAELEKAAKPIATVVATDAPTEPAVPASIPREYAGEMDAKQKKALKDMGIGVSTIVLEENESIPPTGLFIGHNGKSYMIKPGEEVDVPDFLLDVLDDAVMSAPVVDSSTQKVLGYRNRSKYPYRRVNTKG